MHTGSCGINEGMHNKINTDLFPKKLVYIQIGAALQSIKYGMQRLRAAIHCSTE